MENLKIEEYRSLMAATKSFIRTWPDFDLAVNYLSIVESLKQPEIEVEMVDYLELNYAAKYAAFKSESNINYEGL